MKGIYVIKRALGNLGYIYKEAYWKNSHSVRHKKRQKRKIKKLNISLRFVENA